MDTLVSRKMPRTGNSPKNRMMCTMVYYQESLYLIGSLNYLSDEDSALFRYDLNTDEWEILETIGERPSARSFHSAFVYNSEMFIFFGGISEILRATSEIYKYNFERKIWTQLTNPSDMIRILSGTVLIGSKAYFLYGRNELAIYNSIFSIDLSTDPLVITEISENHLSPPERYSHCAYVINLYMYIFAGSSGDLYDDEKYYSDMWRFDLVQKTWESLSPVGDVPSQRKNFGSTKMGGSRIAIFGGENDSGLLNDLYFFHEPYLRWYKLIPFGNSIQERSSSCIVGYKNILFIIGGKSYEKGFDDLWVYDFETNKLQILNKKLTGNNINNVKCWIDDLGSDKIELIITGGNDFIWTPNNYTLEIIIDLTTYALNITTNESINPGCVIKPKSLAIRQGTKILSIGGHIYGSNMINPYILYDLKIYNCEYLNGSDELSTYDHSYAHFNKSLYIFGGGGKIENFKSNNIIYNILRKVEVDSVKSFSLKCSEGFDKSCNLCGKGSYSNAGVCELCPEGTFSQTYGSSNIDQCIPCPYGTFSSNKGSVNCLDCKSSYYCPIGSIRPKPYQIKPSNSTIQPEAYSSEKSTMTKVNRIIRFCFIGIIIFLVISLHFFKISWKFIREIDIFVKNHHKLVNIPIIYSKTHLGGLFTIIFLCTALIIVSGSFLTYYLDNLQEYRALIPVITLNEDIVADYMKINITFSIYGGKCIKGNLCDPQITYQDEGLSYLSRSMRCEASSETCHILISYSKLRLESDKVEISILSRETGSYASSINVNITSDSSIPDQISSVFTSFDTPSPDTVFRGYDPSIVYYRLTPSVITT